MKRYQIISFVKIDGIKRLNTVKYSYSISQACAEAYAITQGWELSFSVKFVDDHLDDVNIMDKHLKESGFDRVTDDKDNREVQIIDLEYLNNLTKSSGINDN